jgi:hypothetical protein
MAKYSLRTTGALTSVVVVISISLFGLLLILLDLSTFRQSSEQARVRAEERHQARLAARLEMQQDELSSSERSEGVREGAAEEERPSTHAATLAVVTCPEDLVAQGGDGGVGGGGRDLLMEAYREARAGKRGKKQ